MKLLRNRSFFMLACAALCLSGQQLSASEQRMPNYEVQETTEDNLNLDAEDFDCDCDLDVDVDVDAKELKKQFVYDDPYLYRLHADSFYHVAAFSGNGDVVQLHDLSKWSVCSSHRKIVLQWVQSDEIFVKPQAKCFSSYRYVLHNRTTDQIAEVNWIPQSDFYYRYLWIEKAETRFIYQDFGGVVEQRLVQLNDGTVWVVDAYDKNFNSWVIGDRVIVGVNNNWRTATFPNILINVEIYKEPYSKIDFYGYAVD